MSLRSYLFALIGSLIILLTITQLFLVYWIEQNLNQEVNVQARNISEQVFELAFEELDKVSEEIEKVKYFSDNINGDGITVITEGKSGNRQIIFRQQSQKAHKIHIFVDTRSCENEEFLARVVACFNFFSLHFLNVKFFLLFPVL